MQSRTANFMCSAGTCSRVFIAGSQVELSASARSGSYFVGWSGDCSSSTNCDVLLDRPRTVTATFAALTGQTYYFADCQPGAAAGCVPGDDANAGTTPQAPKRSLSVFNTGQLPTGSQLLFVRGGAWAIANAFNLYVRALPQPLVLDAYASPHGHTEAPLIVSSGHSVVHANEAVSPSAGLIVRNLHLRGTPMANHGVIAGFNSRDVTLENLDIEGFEIGVLSLTQTPTDHLRFTMRGCWLHDNTAIGFLGGAHDMLVEDNRIESGTMAMWSGAASLIATTGQPGVFRGNVLRPAGRCNVPLLQVSGSWTGLVLERNVVLPSTTGVCGIDVVQLGNETTFFRNLVVRGNVIHGPANISAAPRVLIENNLIIDGELRVGSGPPRAGADADTDAQVRNNTVLRTVGNTRGIALTDFAGTGLVVASNLIVFAAPATGTCFLHPARTHFASFENNLCHHESGVGRWSAQYATLSDAMAQGFDRNGTSASPLFVQRPSAANDYVERFDTSSPVLGAGSPLRSSPIDRSRNVRPAAPDIGAKQGP